MASWFVILSDSEKSLSPFWQILESSQLVILSATREVSMCLFAIFKIYILVFFDFFIRGGALIKVFFFISFLPQKEKGFIPSTLPLAPKRKAPLFTKETALRLFSFWQIRGEPRLSLSSFALAVALLLV